MSVGSAMVYKDFAGVLKMSSAGILDSLAALVDAVAADMKDKVMCSVLEEVGRSRDQQTLARLVEGKAVRDDLQDRLKGVNVQLQGLAEDVQRLREEVRGMRSGGRKASEGSVPLLQREVIDLTGGDTGSTGAREVFYVELNN